MVGRKYTFSIQFRWPKNYLDMYCMIAVSSTGIIGMGEFVDNQ